MSLPPYEPPFKPVPQITPFTYRDGVTMLKKIEHIVRYINRTLIPFVNENYSDLADAFETQVNILIAAVNAAIDEVLNSSVEVQDPIVAELVTTDDTATQTALDGRYGLKSTVDALETLVNSGRLSTVSLDARYGLKSAVDDLQTLVTTGRLSEAELDAKYAQVAKVKPSDKFGHAVFIGSSNSEEWTEYPEKLSAAFGWTYNNYSIGGAGFTTSVASKFLTQLNSAIADTAFDNDDVRFVFITDCSNDARANSTVTAEANTLVVTAKASFPNARVIIVPAVWSYVTDNINAFQSLSVRVSELREVALNHNIEFVEQSELLFWNPIATWADGYHVISAGYDRLVDYVTRHINGWAYNCNLGWHGVVPIASGSVITTFTGRSMRQGSIATLDGVFDVITTRAAWENLASIQIGFRPTIDTVIMVPTSNQTVLPFQILKSGEIRGVVSLPPGTYYFKSAFAVI